MPTTASFKVRPEHLRGVNQTKDRRRYKRFELVLLGRFLRVSTREEFTCRLVDISIGGAWIVTDAQLKLEERVVIYFDELVGLEGTVKRLTPGGFAIDFNLTHRRRQKLAAQITWLLNREELEQLEQRRPGHDRFRIPDKMANVFFADGSSDTLRILDVSISGAALELTERPPIGSAIAVGRRKARVVRHTEKGIGVEFLELQDLEDLKAEFS